MCSKIRKPAGRIYDIELNTSVKPVQHLPRRVPQSMKEDIRVKLDELTKRGIVTKVSGSTDWINSMVAVRKVRNFAFVSTRMN